MRRIIYAIVIAFHFHFFLYKICKYILSCFMLYNESLKSVQNKKSYHLNSYRIAMSNKHLRLLNLKCLVSKRMVFLPVGKCFYYKILRYFLHNTTSVGKNVCVCDTWSTFKGKNMCVWHMVIWHLFPFRSAEQTKEWTSKMKFQGIMGLPVGGGWLVLTFHKLRVFLSS